MLWPICNVSVNNHSYILHGLSMFIKMPYKQRWLSIWQDIFIFIPHRITPNMLFTLYQIPSQYSYYTIDSCYYHIRVISSSLIIYTWIISQDNSIHSIDSTAHPRLVVLNIDTHSLTHSAPRETSNKTPFISRNCNHFASRGFCTSHTACVANKTKCFHCTAAARHTQNKSR